MNPGRMRVWEKKMGLGRDLLKYSGPSAPALGPPPPRVRTRQTVRFGTAGPLHLLPNRHRTCFRSNRSLRSSSEPTHQYSAREISPRLLRASGFCLPPSDIPLRSEQSHCPSCPLSRVLYPPCTGSCPEAFGHPRASAKPRRLCPKVVAAIVCRLKRGCLAPSSQAQCLGWETHAKTSLQQLPGDIQLPCITLNVPRASCNAPDRKADSKGTCTAPPLGCAVTQRGTEYCKPGEPRAREFRGGMHRTHLVQFPHGPQSLDFVAGVFALLQALVAHGHLALHAVHAVILQLMVCAGGDLARAQAPAYPTLGWGHQTVFG